MLEHRLRIPLRTELVQQARRPLHVGEQERHGTGREIAWHAVSSSAEAHPASTRTPHRLRVWTTPAGTDGGADPRAGRAPSRARRDPSSTVDASSAAAARAAPTSSQSHLAHGIRLSGAAPESNRPSRGLHGRTGFKDTRGTQAAPCRGFVEKLPMRAGVRASAARLVRVSRPENQARPIPDASFLRSLCPLATHDLLHRCPRREGDVSRGERALSLRRGGLPGATVAPRNWRKIGS